MSEETKVKQIIEMISIYQDTSFKNLSLEEKNLIVKDLNDKREEIIDELTKLYDSGANPIDDAYVINEMENAITAIDDLLSELSIGCDINQSQVENEPQVIEEEKKEEIIEKADTEDLVEEIFEETKSESEETYTEFEDEVLESNEQEYIEETEENIEEKIEEPQILEEEIISSPEESENTNNTILDILNGNITNNDYKVIAQGIVENRKPSIDNAISKGNSTVQVVIEKIAEALNQNRE